MATIDQYWGGKIAIYGKGKEGFIDKVVKVLNRIKDTKMGGKILERLLEKASKGPFGFVDIEFMPKTFASGPKGSGYKIAIDFEYLKEVKDPTAATLRKKGWDAEVYAYHEVFHTLRHLSGLFKGDSEGALPEEEWTTVGLYEHADTFCSENDFRGSLGLPRRPFYYTRRETKKEREYFDQEIVRRMLLRLPDPPTHRPEEEEFVPNEYNRTLSDMEIRLYKLWGLPEGRAVRRFSEERVKNPLGFTVFTPPSKATVKAAAAAGRR